MKKEKYLTPSARLIPVGMEMGFLTVSGNQNVSIESAREEEWEF